MKLLRSCLLTAIVLGTLLSGCLTIGKPYSPPDYSAHTNADESQYITELIDAEELDDGKAHFALRMYASPRQRKLSELYKDETWNYDLRSCDVSGMDLSKIQNYDDISFDSNTVWPEGLPEGFLPAEILDYNKNPGLSIHKLHNSGVTGEGVGIAIIDQALYTEHEEYADKLIAYELIHCGDESAQMHGSAVASIAVGETVGVAPRAKLYYIGTTHGHRTDSGFEFDASILADCVLRICEVNRYLPTENRIRVISISRGYGENDPGYSELQAAIRQADRQGIFVLTTTTSQFYDFTLCGLDRSYSADPDDPFSYVLPKWMKGCGIPFSDFIFVPMGSRTYASFTGKSNYEISYTGGMSWAVPWCAGFYALCCQVKPDVTPAEFIDVIRNTATEVETGLEDEDRVHSIRIIDPCGAVRQLDASLSVK